MSDPVEPQSPVRLKWDHLPSQNELGGFFVAGVEYLWCLFKNQPHAERTEGWHPIQLRSPGRASSVPLGRFEIAGHDVVLLARGTPILGATPGATGIPQRIDPELEGLLEPLPKLPSVDDEIRAVVGAAVPPPSAAAVTQLSQAPAAPAKRAAGAR